MATKSITIKEHAYEILKSRKEKGESFSDVIERMGKRRPVTDLIDVVSEEEGKEIAEKVEENRKEINQEMENRQKEIKEALE